MMLGTFPNQQSESGELGIGMACLTTSTLGHSFRLFQYSSVPASGQVGYSSTQAATSQISNFPSSNLLNVQFPKLQLPSLPQPLRLPPSLFQTQRSAPSPSQPQRSAPKRPNLTFGKLQLRKLSLGRLPNTPNIRQLEFEQTNFNRRCT